MCACVKTEHIVAGWGCCACRRYNGLQRSTCRACGMDRCSPLLPDTKSGERFETYDEAYENDPVLLDKIYAQLKFQCCLEDTS